MFLFVAHDAHARIDFYRARIVDGVGHVIHERMFAVEIAEGREAALREPTILGDLTAAEPPPSLPTVAALPEVSIWLHEHALQPFLDEVRHDRLTEINRVGEHVELSLTELIQKADEEIGKANAEVERGAQGAEGRLKQADTRQGDLLARRDRRRQELQQQRSLTLQAVERSPRRSCCRIPSAAPPTYSACGPTRKRRRRQCASRWSTSVRRAGRCTTFTKKTSATTSSVST